MQPDTLVPSSTPILSPFPDLATEICEMIFQFSSEPDNPARWGLSLISREVQECTDPILFCHLTFRGMSMDMDDPMDDVVRFDEWVLMLSSSSATSRFKKALSLVRTLDIACSMGITEIAWHTILKSLPQLVAATMDAPWDDVYLDECGEQEEHPALRYICGAITHSFVHQEDCTILSNVTHLEMGRWLEPEAENYFTKWSIFKNLKFLSIDGSGWFDIRNMMFCLPSTVLLVILVLRVDELAYGYLREDFINSYIDGKYDSRLLLFYRGLGVPTRRFGDWVLQGDTEFSAMGELREMWGSREPAFWERGLRMVEERRAGLGHQL